MQVVSLIVHAKGAGEDFSDAWAKAVQRLVEATKEIDRGNLPADPGIDFRTLDPGGGGPCAALRAMDFDVSTSGLPEAKRRNPNTDDD